MHMWKGHRNQNKQEGWFAVIAALIVLFSAMWDPVISVVLSIVFLLIFAINEFRKK